MKLTLFSLFFLLAITLPSNIQAGKAVKKDGWLTKAVEVLPFGGLVTAPFHAVAGNAQEAVKSVVTGLVSGGAMVAGMGPLGVALTPLQSMGVGVVSGALVDIPFTYIGSSRSRNRGTSWNPQINRNVGWDVEYLVLKPLVLVNRWGFALSANDQGQISHRNRNRNRNGWEGWVIEYTGNGKYVYLSRNTDQGKHVLAIDDWGNVQTTTNRDLWGWEGFELTHRKDYGVFIFQRVKEPRYYLACSHDGDIVATQTLNLEGWEAWIPE